MHVGKVNYRTPISVKHFLHVLSGSVGVRIDNNKIDVLQIQKSALYSFIRLTILQKQFCSMTNMTYMQH